MSSTQKSHGMIVISTILYYAGSFIAETIPRGQFILVFALGLMCISLAMKTGGRISIQFKSILPYILIFLAYCAASMRWAESPSLSVPKVNALFFIFLAMIVIHLCFAGHITVEDLLLAIMYGGYIVTFYIIARYGVSGIIQMLSSSSRINNDVLNANTLGMCAANSIIINIYFILYDRIRIRDVLIAPALVLTIVSQSRKAIILVAAGVVGLYVLKNMKKDNIGQSLLKILIGLVVLGVAAVAVSRIPAMEPIVRRMREIFEMMAGNGKRGQNSAWIRFAYNQLGMDLFREHPILGIGIGNANIYTQMYYGHNHYLHNNYIEMLACAGIVGFVLYYWIWAYLLWVFFKYRKQGTGEFDICLILLGIHLVLDWAAVSYFRKDTYLFLMLFWMEAQKLIQAKKLSGSAEREPAPPPERERNR